MSMIDPYFLGLSKLAEAVSTLLIKLRSERVRRNKIAADYFSKLASGMFRVLEALKKRDVPRIDGHEMEMMLRAFDDKTTGLLDSSASKELKEALEGVALIARTLDGHYIVHRPEIEAVREEMLRMIERMIGDLRGLSGIFDSGTN